MDKEQVEVLDVSVGPEVVSSVSMRGAVVSLELFGTGEQEA
ncbi:hypothetical protein [Brachybacterium sp. NBEC-018]|nr:hypothetical protein [Brachybacterium sp. NBEC-018]